MFKNIDRSDLKPIFVFVLCFLVILFIYYSASEDVKEERSYTNEQVERIREEYEYQIEELTYEYKNRLETRYSEGYSAGYDDAESELSFDYNEGYDDGYSSGYETGYEDSNPEKYSEGYNEGYEDGLEEGLDPRTFYDHHDSEFDPYEAAYDAGIMFFDKQYAPDDPSSFSRLIYDGIVDAYNDCN